MSWLYHYKIVRHVLCSKHRKQRRLAPIQKTRLTYSPSIYLEVLVQRETFLDRLVVGGGPDGLVDTGFCV
jgi:hypothetical protein